MSKIEQKLLSDQIYSKIATALTEGNYRPGHALVIRKLAEAYGTSPTPVREAIKRLVAEHVLEMSPSCTAFVPLMNEDKFQQLFTIRCELEGLATELAVPNITRKTKNHLNRILNNMDVSIDNKDIHTYLNLNKEFHFCIYSHCNNPELIRFIKKIWMEVGPVFRHLFSTDCYWSCSNDFHRKIYDYIGQEDSTSARCMMKKDLYFACKALLDNWHNESTSLCSSDYYAQNS